jgi:C1A family cysteine protease
LHRGYIKSKNSSIEYRAVATNRAYRSNGHTFYVYTYTPGYQLKPSVDWLARGFNTPVRNQGSCGSCWAFAATGSIEAAMWIKSKIKVVLSPQQLVDCSTNYGNLGCDGGVVGWGLIKFIYYINKLYK